MRRLGYYRLDGKTPVACDLMEWAETVELGNRHVALEMIYGMRVSTIFLGVDHNYSFSGDPVLFETMVFVGRSGCVELQVRYCTWDEAEAGHKGIVAHIKSHPLKCAVLPWLECVWRKIMLPILQVVINKLWELSGKIKRWMR